MNTNFGQGTENESLATESLILHLYESIETLYDTFKSYPLKETIDGCPCCVGKTDQLKLHYAPLRELSSDDLGKYAFKAMTTWGDSRDYRHFFPRLFEISITEYSVEYGLAPWLIGKKLSYSDWHLWPLSERSAISDFIETAWKVILLHPPILSDPPEGLSTRTSGPVIWVKEDALALIVNAGIELTSYLVNWIPSNRLVPHLHVARFVATKAPSSAKKKSLELPTIDDKESIINFQDWLLRPEVLESVEKCFNRELEVGGVWADLLANGVDAVEWMLQANQDRDSGSAVKI